MGQLIMTFNGLCMHMGPDAGLPSGVVHRVVAINAPATNTQFGLLPAHVCTIDLPSGPMQLNGWQVQVLNPSPSDTFAVDLTVPNPRVGAQYASAPHLTMFDPAMQLLPSLHLSGPPTWAAAYVDIAQGRVTAEMFDEFGIFTTWNVQTDGDPVLRLTPLEGPAIDVPLPPFAVVKFANSTTDPEHKQFDFVLYYLAAQGGIPLSFAVPPPGTQDLHVLRFFGTTTSCSNSQYP